MTGPRLTEAQKVEQAVAGMPAPQALRFLAELVQPGGSRARGEAAAALLVKVAKTLEAHQATVRTGIPVDSAEGKSVEIREYAIRAVHPDGTTLFTTYGDRLFTAVQDAVRLPDGEVLHRDVVVGPWVSGTTLPAPRA